MKLNLKKKMASALYESNDILLIIILWHGYWGHYCSLTDLMRTESGIDNKKLTLKYVASTLIVVVLNTASGPVDNTSQWTL